MRYSFSQFRIEDVVSSEETIENRDAYIGTRYLICCDIPKIQKKKTICLVNTIDLV